MPERLPDTKRADLDPALRARLLREVNAPWRGLRRAIWLALTASAAIGLAAMALRISSGETAGSADLLIQISALLLFGLLLWRDRDSDLSG